MNKIEEAERNRLIDRIELLEAEVADLRSKLNRCFSGDTVSVRKELVLSVLKRQTDKLLEMPEEDIRDYLSRTFDN